MYKYVLNFIYTGELDNSYLHIVQQFNRVLHPASYRVDLNHLPILVICICIYNCIRTYAHIHIHINILTKIYLDVYLNIHLNIHLYLRIVSFILTLGCPLYPPFMIKSTKCSIFFT